MNDGTAAIIGPDFEGEHNESRARSTSNKQALNNTLRTGDTAAESFEYLSASVNDKVYKCDLEPDKEITVFPRHMITQKSNESMQESPNSTIISVAETLGVGYETEIILNFCGRLIKVRGVVSETVGDKLLGNDFLLANKDEVDLDPNYLSMHSWEFKLFPQTTRARCGRKECGKSSTSTASRRSLFNIRGAVFAQISEIQCTQSANRTSRVQGRRFLQPGSTANTNYADIAYCTNCHKAKLVIMNKPEINDINKLYQSMFGY